jgi:cell division protein FtsQ
VSTAPENRRRAKPARGPAKDLGDGAPMLFSDDESPAPGLASNKTDRPPPAPKKPKSKVLRGLELVAGTLVVVAASIAVAWGAHRYVMQSPRFAVKTIAVDGARRRSPQTVAHLGGLEVGKNIFSVDLPTAGASITQDPWIEKASVTRKLPGTLEVHVVEREAAVMASIGSDLYLATREGDLFKKIGEGDPTDLPIITGILVDAVTKDRPGVVLAIKRALDVVDDLDRAGISKRYPIQEVHLDKDESLNVVIGREGITLSLGHGPYKAKILEGARILNEVARRKANASVIFLDNDAHPERVVVRMR